MPPLEGGLPSASKGQGRASQDCPDEMARGLSSAGRALQWHCRGQRFDPARLHHFSKRVSRDRDAPVDEVSSTGIFRVIHGTPVSEFSLTGGFGVAAPWVAVCAGHFRHTPLRERPCCTFCSL